jgi:uncharacterized protein (DUF934 family)
MPTLINRQGLIGASNPWVRFNGDAGAVAQASHILLPLEVLKESADLWFAHAQKSGARLGAVLSAADDINALAPFLEKLDLIAIDFAQFVDGRGFSQARLVRGRLGWTKELRAIGDLLRDQLFFLARCGFDSFELAEDQQPATAAQEFKAFSETYQAAQDREALFARRVAQAA